MKECKKDKYLQNDVSAIYTEGFPQPGVMLYSQFLMDFFSPILSHIKIQTNY